MPPLATRSMKKCPVMRFPRSRPYMSGKAASTVSISPRSISSPSCSNVSMPCAGASFIRTILSPVPLVRSYVHVLDLRVEVKRLHAQLAPESTHLEAAERRLDEDRSVAVYAQHACPDAAD